MQKELTPFWRKNFITVGNLASCEISATTMGCCILQTVAEGDSSIEYSGAATGPG